MPVYRFRKMLENECTYNNKKKAVLAAAWKRAVGDTAFSIPTIFPRN